MIQVRGMQGTPRMAGCAFIWGLTAGLGLQPRYDRLIAMAVQRGL